MSERDHTDDRLAAQYEALPYPARDPAQEAKHLWVGSPSHLREIDHWLFGAARPLRALFAGGGTGDGAIMLAQQMQWAGRPGHVTWLDRSEAARRIVERRAAARDLGNIGFATRSLLDLPGSGLGPFDYIDCCGVLHHLPEPAAGLAALLSVLAPCGGLGLMVYAPHGRTGVYMLQDALARLAPPTDPTAVRLDTAKRVLRHLPATNWFRANPSFTDITKGGDAGLYDLLLNPRDRAYTIADFAALLHGAGLRIACLVEPMRYDPSPLLPDARLRGRLAGLDPIGRAALAEALSGNMPTHIAYCVRADTKLPARDHRDPAAVPVARETPMGDFADRIRGGVLMAQFDALTVPVPMPALAPAILRRIDGVRSVAEIAAPFPARSFDPAWDQVFGALNAMNRLLLAGAPP
jgi:SAM-dependent methyltransferase